MEEPTSKTTTPHHDVRTLVAEGNAALIAGDSYTARQRFRQALELDPERVEAWVGLAGSVRPYREKREHLTRALAIDPANPEARAVLAQVEARLAAGEVLAPGGVQVREPTPAPAEEPPPPEVTEPPPAPSDIQYCYIHPDRETGLRCTSCDRPICADCVRPAAVGQLCPECAKARRPVNYQVSALNATVASGVTVAYSVALTTVGVFLFGNLGFFSFIVAFLLGPVAGDLLVRLLDRLVRSKRGRVMQTAVGAAYAMGILLTLAGLGAVLAGSLAPGVIAGLFFSLPWGLHLFNVIAVVTAVARLR